jgi:hypothetical protein
MTEKGSPSSYNKTSDAAKFREQYRFAFSIAIVATVFIIPSENVFGQFLQLTLGFSAFPAALYIIASAARVKYNEPGRIYQVLYIGERFRMRLFDWSIDVFGASLLFFIASLITNQINTVFRLEPGSILFWVLLILIMFILGIFILLISIISNKIKKKGNHPKKDLPKV